MVKSLPRPRPVTGYKEPIIKILLSGPQYSIPPGCLRKTAAEAWNISEATFCTVVHSLIEEGVIKIDKDLHFKLDWERYNELYAAEEE